MQSLTTYNFIAHIHLVDDKLWCLDVGWVDVEVGGELMGLRGAVEAEQARGAPSHRGRGRAPRVLLRGHHRKRLKGKDADQWNQLQNIVLSLLICIFHSQFSWRISFLSFPYLIT